MRIKEKGAIMKRSQRETLANNVANCGRFLLTFGFLFDVKPPDQQRKKGNSSPYVIHVTSGKLKGMRIYNDTSGATWANLGKKPLPKIHTNLDLYEFLKERINRGELER